MNDLQRRFGQLVAAHRKRAGLTQDALAAKAGLSVDMISRIETGATGARFPTILKLSDALEVDPAELFSSEVPSGAKDRAALSGVVSRLGGLSDRDLSWVTQLLDVALRRR